VATLTTTAFGESVVAGWPVTFI